MLSERLYEIQQDSGKKIMQREFKSHVASYSDTISELKKELLLKSNIKDVFTLVDVKADIEDMKNSFSSVHRELDKKTGAEDFASAMADQSLINGVLCAENCVGRWVWKSGEIKNGYAVPWEAQSVNTCPDNFLWEKDKTSVMAVAAGLYEIKLAVFSSRKAAVQLLVNGEPLFQPIKSSPAQIKGKPSVSHSMDKALSGLSLVDFVSLPPRARITLSYGGEPEAEGFLALRKL